MSNYDSMSTTEKVGYWRRVARECRHRTRQNDEAIRLCQVRLLGLEKRREAEKATEALAEMAIEVLHDLHPGEPI